MVDRTPVVGGIGLSDDPIAPHLDEPQHHALALRRALDDSGLRRDEIDGDMCAGGSTRRWTRPPRWRSTSASATGGSSFEVYVSGPAPGSTCSPATATSTAATVALYERLSGRALDDLGWYEAFAGLRFGIILARMSLRSSAFGLHPHPANPDDLMLFAPLLRRLLDDV